MKQSKEHLERINKVVRHIEQAIDREMSLDELASIACFSPFHFQRITKVDQRKL
jgi:AraC family transcriptional regulator